MILLDMNTKVKIYPTKAGWYKIFEIAKDTYNLTDKKTTEWIERRKFVKIGLENNDSFKEQLWILFRTYNQLFFEGSPYLRSTNILICDME